MVTDMSLGRLGILIEGNRLTNVQIDLFEETSLFGNLGTLQEQNEIRKQLLPR